MAITTMDGLVAALGTSQDQKLFMPSVTQVAGGWIHLNQAAVNSFGQLAAPTAYSSGGLTYTQSNFSAGSGFPKWTAGSGTTTYIGRVGATPSGAGTLHVYDAAWACTGFAGNTTSAQSVTGFTGMPTRYSSSSVGLECWVFCTTATGATASNITVQYTNQAGTSGRNTVSTAMITSMPANRMFQVPLQSGDTGINSVQSVTLSASTGTAGSFGVILAKRIASIPMPIANVGQVQDFASLGFPAIDDNVCLLFVHQGTTTTTGIIMGLLSVVQG